MQGKRGHQADGPPTAGAAAARPCATVQLEGPQPMEGHPFLELPRPPLPVEELEHKHRIQVSRQRAVHLLERAALDRAYARQRLAEEALQAEEEALARARDSGAAAVPPPSAALAALSSAAAAACAGLRREGTPGAAASSAGGGALATLLLQQRLSQRHLLAQMLRDTEKPCHKAVPLAGMSTAAWDASQALTTPYPWPSGPRGEGEEDEDEEEEEEEEGEEEAAGAAGAPAATPAAAEAASATADLADAPPTAAKPSAAAPTPSPAEGGAASASASASAAAPPAAAAAAATAAAGSRKRKKLTLEERDAKKLASWGLQYSGLCPCARCGVHVQAKTMVDCDGCGRSLCGRGGHSASEPLAGPCVSISRCGVPSGGFTCYDCALGEESRGLVMEPYFFCAVGKMCARPARAEGAGGPPPPPAMLGAAFWATKLATCPSCDLKFVCRKCRQAHTKECPGRGFKDVRPEEEAAEEAEEAERARAGAGAGGAGGEEAAVAPGRGEGKKRRRSEAAAAAAAAAAEEEEEAPAAAAAAAAARPAQASPRTSKKRR